MLVLQRNHRDRVIVTHQGETMVLTVLINRGRVQIGIDAPLSFRIVREEAKDKQEHIDG